MYVMNDQLMRRDGRQPLKLLVSNHIMSPSENCSWVLPDTFSDLTLPFGMSGGRRERHHLKRRVGEEGTVRMMGEVVISPFSSFSLRFFVATASWGKGSFFIPLTHTYLSLLYLVAISVKTKSERDVRSRNTKRKKEGEGRYVYFFLLKVLFSTCIEKA